MTKITTWLKGLFGPKPPNISHNEILEDNGKSAAGSGGFKVLRFQHTPNPEAAQFVMDGAVIRPGGTRTFDSPQSAQGDSMAAALFKIFGVESIFLKENFVTVTKSAVVGWTAIMGPIQDTLERSLAFYTKADEDAHAKRRGASLLEEVDVEDFPGFSDEQKEKVIDAMLEQAIRPALANDGGGITLIGVQGNTVKVHYQGACGSCPSSTAGTLQYIESFLKDTLHSDLRVETTDQTF